MNDINTAIIHPAIRHAEFDENCKTLTAMNIEASENGAQIILNTEMSLSGYSFQSRKDISDYAVSENSKIIKIFRKISAKYKNYICLGAVFRPGNSEIISNAAIVFNPEGDIQLCYKKISGEAKWACCGRPDQDNTFNTPWGKVGVLICSDSYFSMLSRSTVLRGARMILAPANWPNMGIDPAEVWRARAIENDVFLLAANRAGQDKTMNFSAAFSCAFDGSGNCLLKRASENSSIFYIRLPLKDGKIKSANRHISERAPKDYGNIYLSFRNIKDITDHCSLPPAGDIKIFAYSSVPGKEEINRHSSSITLNMPGTLFIFPNGDHDERLYKELTAISNSAIFFNSSKKKGGEFVFVEKGEMRYIDAGDPVATFGPAKIAFLRTDEIYHPERFLHFSKVGCDICVICGGSANEEIKLLSEIRSIERAVIAVAFNGFSSISLPPKGHERWVSAISNGSGYSEMQFNTEKTRDKRFVMDYDYELLLSSE